VFRKKFEKFLKDRRAVSDALVILLLIAIGAVVATGIGSVLLTKAPKQTAPVANIVIEPVTGGVIIRHEGGDMINVKDLKLVIYKYPEMENVNEETLPINGITTDIAPSGMFNAGDVIFRSIENAGTYEVDLIHIPTQTKIARNVVTVGSGSGGQQQ
jgi:FlaG/FlaF family flagellin (archaellin)